MNEFKFFGRAIEKPQLQESEKGLKYCNLLIGVDKPYKNQDGVVEVENFKITCFKSLAEDLCEKIKKGKGIIISGRLQENNFTKSNPDNNNYRADLVGERVTYTD